MAIAEQKKRTKEEWNALKEEVETLNKKLAELSDEELDQVNGGMASAVAADQARGKRKLEQRVAKYKQL